MEKGKEKNASNTCPEKTNKKREKKKYLAECFVGIVTCISAEAGPSWGITLLFLLLLILSTPLRDNILISIDIDIVRPAGENLNNPKNSYWCPSLPWTAIVRVARKRKTAINLCDLILSQLFFGSEIQRNFLSFTKFNNCLSGVVKWKQVGNARPQLVWTLTIKHQQFGGKALNLSAYEPPSGDCTWKCWSVHFVSVNRCWRLRCQWIYLSPQKVMDS